MFGHLHFVCESHSPAPMTTMAHQTSWNQVERQKKTPVHQDMSPTSSSIGSAYNMLDVNATLIKTIHKDGYCKMPLLAQYQRDVVPIRDCNDRHPNDQVCSVLFGKGGRYFLDNTCDDLLCQHENTSDFKAKGTCSDTDRKFCLCFKAQ